MKRERSKMITTKSVSNKYFTLAMAAGVCGSLSSLFGKLCFDSDLVKSFTGDSNTYLFYGFRALFFVLLVLSNVLMTSLFTRSLDSSDNSFTPTIINFSSNFLFTVKPITFSIVLKRLFIYQITITLSNNISFHFFS